MTVPLTNSSTSHSSHVDVLIVGAGPMGLMSALWMAEFGLKVRIIDKRGTRALNGRADGFHVRSLEIWDSFGLGHVFATHGTRVSQWDLWAPDGKGGLMRQKQDGTIGTDSSRFIPGTMHQGNIEAALIDAIKRRAGIEVERGVIPTRIVTDNTKMHDHTAHAVVVDLRRVNKEELGTWTVNAHRVQDGIARAERGHIDANVVPNDGSDTVPTISGEPGSTETVHAKYVIGADGGQSWVRRQLGFAMEGATYNAKWGVIDAVLDTGFPDFKKHRTILSPAGTVLSITRENNMTRLYIQLPGSDMDQYEDGILTAQHLMAAAAKVLEPFRLSYSYCDCWTIYKVGQRVSDHFDYGQRIFLGGDAVHTHTPKGGQGMNVSMQDAYNLGWKVAGVAKQQLNPAILPTYESERRPIAELLIEIDTVLAGNLSQKDRKTTLDANAAYDKLRAFNSGANICYEPSLVVVSLPPGKPVTSLPLGMRLPPFPIFNLASVLPVDLQELCPSDGLWRLLVFGGDVTNPTQLSRVNNLGMALSPLLSKFRSLEQSGPSFLVPLLLISYEFGYIDLGYKHIIIASSLVERCSPSCIR
ncbi:FAD/NAD(P)-binding domain-containing protein [Bimuria novae-zelandiae CBS 107.79]|uniref:FAD/NAD(P)-binding domain-containing protein n=1 Tax=Bimuria novae-zelandiae CBS 107.79 TaxID=1447943 RepID=A0A6A5VE92_9PLEO|nr:FAD/NAD(P)-binding domain-containing protein [Bimuria novae-zelandiae CBS 107.79]